MSNTIPAKKVKRPGAGRTKGSFSFVLLTLAEAASLNPNPSFKFMFGRKQIEGLGGNNFVTAKAGELTESLSGQSVETVPAVKSEEL